METKIICLVCGVYAPREDINYCYCCGADVTKMQYTETPEGTDNSSAGEEILAKLFSHYKQEGKHPKHLNSSLLDRQPEFKNVPERCYNCANFDDDVMTASEDIPTDLGLVCGEVPCGTLIICTGGCDMLAEECRMYKTPELRSTSKY